MAERYLFVTGHLAKARLERLLASLGDTAFGWAVVDIGVKVAALMTEEIIRRRLKLPRAPISVVLPGRCRGDLERLAAHFGVPFVRGPDEIADLPAFLGRAGAPPDLSPPRHAHLRRDRRGADAVAEALAREGAATCRPPAPTSSTSAACRTRRFRISTTPCEC